ncbi:hypothetical protein KM043_007690 [Ampulex compressa]|nr:hypothetical protein KM043_007690 [Ampulex compressa]
MPDRQSSAHLQCLRKRLYVLQFPHEAHQGGMRTGAKVSVSLLSEEDETALQFAQAHAQKALLRGTDEGEDLKIRRLSWNDWITSGESFDGGGMDGKGGC